VQASTPDAPHVLAKFMLGHIGISGLLFSPQQSCTTVVPGSALNPAGHVAHTVAPVAFWNVSAGHDRQAAVALSGWYFPDSQLVHASDPIVFLYLPTSHTTHGPPCGPV
jgi:hypothetical protein